MAVPWLLIATTANRVLTAGTQLVVGYLLVPSAIGTFAVAAGMAAMLSPFQSADHARLALQDRQQPLSTAAALRNWLLLGSLGCCLSSIALIAFGSLRVEVAPLICLALLALLRVIGNGRIALLARSRRSGAIAAASVVEGGLRSVGLVALALLGAGMWSLVGGEVLAALGSVILVDRLAPTPPPCGMHLPPGIFPKLVATSAISCLVAIELNCPAVAIGWLFSPADAGSYAFANRIANQMTVLALPLVALEAIPRLLQARSSPGEFQHVSAVECRRLAALIAPLSLFFALAGPWAIGLLWGDRWHEAGGMLRYLALVVGLRIGYAFAKGHLEALGSFSSILYLTLGDAALLLLTLAMASWRGSAQGVVAALTLEALVMLLLAAWVVRKCQRRTRSVGMWAGLPAVQAACA